MNKAFLLIGGNVGERKKNLDKAIQLLEEQAGKIVKTSSVYETAAWGKTDQAAFLNQALEIDTDMNAKQLMQTILKIEKTIGRERKEKYGPRIMDIDIIFFNSDRYNNDFLRIPHPEMQNRRFVLLPLAEIAPSYIHPELKKTVIELLSTCPDELAVNKYF